MIILVINLSVLLVIILVINLSSITGDYFSN